MNSMNINQMPIIIHCMEQNPVMKSGIINNYTIQFWESLTNFLNNIGPPQKDVNGWNTAWNEWKNDVMRKYTQNYQLTEIDTRIVRLMVIPIGFKDVYDETQSKLEIQKEYTRKPQNLDANIATGDKIKTFVALDIEVSQNDVGPITELCFYAFSADCLTDETERQGYLPRNVQKLRLMINPNQQIKTTNSKLTYEMLQHESTFDEDTAECIDSFLNDLPKPICWVAHNGLIHDFPRIATEYRNIKRALPQFIYVADTFYAARIIDDNYQNIMAVINNNTDCNILLQNLIDIFYKVNEPKKYRWGTYPMYRLYERIFKKRLESAHTAEGDTRAVIEVILYYGILFQAFAEEYKQTLENVLTTN